MKRKKARIRVVAKASSMLYSESCNPEPGWALELAGVDLAALDLVLFDDCGTELVGGTWQRD
jgi:hypothetical protein